MNGHIVKTITLQIGDQEVELTLNDARNIYNALEQLFSGPLVNVPNDYTYSPMDGNIMRTN